MTSTSCSRAARRHSSAGHGSSGLRMTIAQSISSPKRSRQSMMSSVKPLAGPGATPRRPVEPVVADGAQRLPDGLARVAGAVGVVQQQQVEGVDPDPLEAALGGHPHVVGVLGPARPAQARVGEARVALGALALALVEVVPDRADDADAVAVGAGERAAEQAVGLARAVGVGGEHACRGRHRASAAPRGAPRRSARRNAGSGRRSRCRSRCGRACACAMKGTWPPRFGGRAAGGRAGRLVGELGDAAHERARLAARAGDAPHQRAGGER